MGLNRNASPVLKDTALKKAFTNRLNKPAIKDSKQLIQEQIIKKLREDLQKSNALLPYYRVGELTREDLDDGLEGLITLSKNILWDVINNTMNDRKASAIVRMIKDISQLHLNNEEYKKVKELEDMKTINSDVIVS